MKKESKFFDKRINRMRLISLIAHINRLSIFVYLRISIYSNASIWFYKDFWIPNAVSNFRLRCNYIQIYLYLAAFRDLIPLYIFYIFNFSRSAAVTFNYFIAPFLRFNLGIPNNVRTHRKALRGKGS
jgi:hypothetical protein